MPCGAIGCAALSCEGSEWLAVPFMQKAIGFHGYLLVNKWGPPTNFMRGMYINLIEVRIWVLTIEENTAVGQFPLMRQCEEREKEKNSITCQNAGFARRPN